MSKRRPNPWGMVPEKLAKALEELGYREPLPIQVKAYPIIYRGYNALIVAPTGSGKTEAALIPILARLVSDKVKPGGGVRLVYVTPLRALNRDLELRVEKLAGRLGYSIQVRHGDTGSRGRRRFLEEPPDIMITTPESFGLLMTVPKAKKALSTVRWVVVDELHELMESKRGVELALNLEKLGLIAGRRVQRIGLSATLSKNSLERAGRLLSPSGRVHVVVDPTPKRYEISVEVVSEGDGDFWRPAVSAIADIIRKEGGSVLVFANTRSTVETLSVALSRMLGEPIPAHHGSLSRHVRERVEKDFREGRVKAIVATSSLELGIDIGRVGLVVQFMSPRQVLALVQRAGRAGHRYGETSRAVVIAVDNLYEVLEAHVLARRAVNGDLEDIDYPKKPLDALAHFSAGAAIDKTPGDVDSLYRLATSTAPYFELDKGELDSVIDLLESVRVLRVGESGEIRRGARTYSYFYRVSMIPDEKTFRVHDVVSGRDVGEIGERFLQLRLMKAVDPKSKPYIVLGGRVWRILDVDLDAGKVVVSPEAEIEGVVPVWEGELIPVDFKVAREVCSIIHLALEDREAGARLLTARRVDGDILSRLLGILAKSRHAWGGESPAWRRPLVEESSGIAVLYACLGSRGNFALSLLIAKMLEPLLAVEFHYIPYAIVFKAHASRGLGKAVAKSLKTLASMDKVERIGLLYDSVRRSKAYLVRFYQVAKRMGVVDADATLSIDVVRKMADAMRGTPVDVETVRELVFEKLDVDAVNRFLDDLEDVAVVRVSEPSPLAGEVLSNPYLRIDTAVSLKSLGMEKIISAKKKRLAEKMVTLLCIGCGRTTERRVGEIPYGKPLRCSFCGSLAIAPLPPTDMGKTLASAYLKKRRGERLDREERKMAREVEERARLHLALAGEGKSRYVVEALSARGVGPKRARSLLRELQVYGEQRFYSELIRAEEEYAANRRYWREPKRQ